PFGTQHFECCTLDHSDNSPCPQLYLQLFLSFSTSTFLGIPEFLGSRGKKRREKRDYAKNVKSKKLVFTAGLRAKTFHESPMLSSQGRYNHFDTTPYELAQLL
ncbi:MAG: hypothetical protein V8T01_10705, partial [Oscillospiraceae bacterium]